MIEDDPLELGKLPRQRRRVARHTIRLVDQVKQQLQHLLLLDTSLVHVVHPAFDRRDVSDALAADRTLCSGSFGFRGGR